ncbi:hypothetical protein SHI21_08210 [Bacteriovorax sp. PP10]|uniref:Uncharacterized protein n=1 Tax=Bacteriovorax antarcticus TaxID=3088717 RepID=A0ABU5VT01_9BACT|nr:hypothetical protein [Bacteriovorax sp. PP10]MEA9356181.1 hypothetical protein [Bacteriovorax sp. PP10]
MKKEPLTHHILPTSSNLLGICFFILSYIKVGSQSRTTLIDECVIIPIILFFVASVLSYISMRSPTNNPRIERMADNVFMMGLLSLSLIAIILVLEFIK